MGKKKISFDKKIENTTTRNVTYCKRKKGLIRKAMQLSVLCDQQILLCVFDKQKQKLVTYQSNESFTPERLVSLELELKNSITREFYLNEDYDHLSEGGQNQVLGKREGHKAGKDIDYLTFDNRIKEMELHIKESISVDQKRRLSLVSSLQGSQATNSKMESKEDPGDFFQQFSQKLRESK